MTAGSFEKAQVHLANGDYEKAVRAFKSVLKEEPENPDAYFGLAEAATAVPKHTVIEIAGWYRKSIDLDPGNVLFRTTYADFCLENGVFKAAEEQYLAAAEMDWENEHIYLADLAINYKLNAEKHLEKTGMTEEEVNAKVLGYCLKALRIPPDEAVKLLTVKN